MQIPKTVIIGCAGVGSRLGLGQTKALITLYDKPLIIWQLEQLQNIEDLRIVVGFQANDVIETVLQYRKNVTFVFNHDYFHIKTTPSLFLASKYAEDFVLTIDGDTIFHPEDFKDCLEENEPFIGVAEASSEEAVFTRIQDKNVLSFSRESGEYEWIGPALLPKKFLQTSENIHLYEAIEKYLPIKYKLIRSMDIDTMQDYYIAQEKIKLWYNL